MDSNTSNNETQQPNLICRPARAEDTPYVLELTRTIWEGDDYVPRVWESWLEDLSGHSGVAELDGRVVGVVRVNRITPHECWLQGLRVAPEFEGRGIASRLHEYILEYCEKNFTGIIRLATWKPQVRHLCERTGFSEHGMYSEFIAETLDDHPSCLQRVSNFEWQVLLEQIFPQVNLPIYSRLMDSHWKWNFPSQEILESGHQEGRVWNSRPDEILILREDEEEGELLPYLDWIYCTSDRLADNLTEMRRLAAQQGYRRVGWAAPLESSVQIALDMAGFVRSWDGFVWIFEKEIV